MAQIHVPPGDLAVSLLAYVRDTALVYAVAVTIDLNVGGFNFTPARPVATFSTGERILWALLVDLAAGHQPQEPAEAVEWLDGDNLAAVRRVLGGVAA